VKTLTKGIHQSYTTENPSLSEFKLLGDIN